MKNIFTLIFFFAILHFSQAQNAIIKGKIIDNITKEPLIGVNVILNDGSGAATDINGDYKISVAPGNYTIIFRFIGYTSQNQALSLVEGEVRTIDISLVEANTELDVVVVSAGR